MANYAVLVACEFSGVVRDAFIERGISAVSCDLEPSMSSAGDHIQSDVLPLLRYKWRLVIAHPPCTYLTVAGARWMYRQGRVDLAKQAAKFFRACYDANSTRVCVENPASMILIARSLIGVGPPDQVISPHMFGHPWHKRTGLWLRGLPDLIETDVVDAEYYGTQFIYAGGYDSKETKQARSKMCKGIADAMADQWGSLLDA